MSSLESSTPPPDGAPELLPPESAPAESTTAAPANGAVPAAPEPTVLAVESPPVDLLRPPHPNFWFGCLWCLLFAFFINGTAVAVLIAEIVVQALRSGNAKGYLAEVAGHGDLGDELVRLLAPALLVAEVGSVILAWVVVRLIVGPDWTRRLAFRLPSPSHVALVVLGLPPLLLLPGILHELARHVLPGFGNLESNAKLFSGFSIWFGVFVVGVLPGVGEELWCRGFLGRGFVGHYGWFAGVLLTSLWFGTLHVDPPYIVGTAVMGIYLHYVYAMSRSLPLSMLLHALNNSIAVLLVQPALARSVEPLEQATGHPAVAAASGFLLVAVAAALLQSRARLATADGRAPWRPAFSGVEEPPAGCGTVVVRPWPSWLAWGLVAVAVAAFAVTLYLGFVRPDLLPWG
jgi:membrane protease YdiL (CAAX protease family)